MKKRVTYRPGKGSGVLGIVMGAVFLVIGLTVAIPVFGAFGVLWTVAAAAITVYQAYLAFGKKYVGPEIAIEDDETQAGESVQDRLAQLEQLRSAELITQEEYQQKRQEILAEL